MTKYKSDIAESASSMMQLPDTLEGMLRDIHGQTKKETFLLKKQFLRKQRKTTN